MMSVCWRDVSTEEVARKSPGISYVIDKHFTDQVSYICISNVLLEIPAGSVSISLENVIFLPNN